MVVCNFIIPFPILAIKKLRTIRSSSSRRAASSSACGWSAFLIIVPTLSHPYLPYNYGTYWPSLTEMRHRSGHARLVRAAVFPVREVQPDDLDLGVRGRIAGRRQARGELPDPTFVGQTVSGDVHPGH
jgi:hypothetical protein